MSELSLIANNLNYDYLLENTNGISGTSLNTQKVRKQSSLKSREISLISVLP